MAEKIFTTRNALGIGTSLLVEIISNTGCSSEQIKQQSVDESKKESRFVVDTSAFETNPLAGEFFPQMYSSHPSLKDGLLPEALKSLDKKFSNELISKIFEKKTIDIKGLGYIDGKFYINYSDGRTDTVNLEQDEEAKLVLALYYFQIKVHEQGNNANIEGFEKFLQRMKGITRGNLEKLIKDSKLFDNLYFKLKPILTSKRVEAWFDYSNNIDSKLNKKIYSNLQKLKDSSAKDIFLPFHQELDFLLSGVTYFTETSKGAKYFFGVFDNDDIKKLINENYYSTIAEIEKVSAISFYCSLIWKRLGAWENSNISIEQIYNKVYIPIRNEIDKDDKFENNILKLRNLLKQSTDFYSNLQKDYLNKKTNED